jgi:N,N-dimethylformamidase
MVEVRRGNGGTRAWNSAPGEQYHSATGEMGGLWRHRGKAPNAVGGIGFSGMGWDSPTPGYQRQPGSFDPRAAFIFEGVGADVIIGNFGSVLGGAAGDEIDRLDYTFGTPPHALLLATATGHSRKYLPVIEDILELTTGLIEEQDPNVRADMVYFETPNEGAVFSSGSITWCGSLGHNGYENNVSRITENVLRKFLT